MPGGHGPPAGGRGRRRRRAGAAVRHWTDRGCRRWPGRHGEVPPGGHGDRYWAVGAACSPAPGRHGPPAAGQEPGVRDGAAPHRTGAVKPQRAARSARAGQARRPAAGRHQVGTGRPQPDKPRVRAAKQHHTRPAPRSPSRRRGPPRPGRQGGRHQPGTRQTRTTHRRTSTGCGQRSGTTPDRRREAPAGGAASEGRAGKADDACTRRRGGAGAVAVPDPVRAGAVGRSPSLPFRYPDRPAGPSGYRRGRPAASGSVSS